MSSMSQSAPVPSSFGPLLKRWRQQRGLSQLDLALASSGSQRHISFLESGRAKPSRDMVLRLATILDVPLRDQNVLLTAARFAPIYSETSLEDPVVAPIRQALAFMQQRQEPYPALVVDRYWNLLQYNQGAARLFQLLLADPQVLGIDQQVNMLRLMFHPQGLRPAVTNWLVVARHLLQRLQQEAIAAGDSEPSRALLQELMTYPDVPQTWDADGVEQWQVPLLTLDLITTAGQPLRFFSTIATLGTPYDITLQELRIECLFPADGETDARVRDLARANG